MLGAMGELRVGTIPCSQEAHGLTGETKLQSWPKDKQYPRICGCLTLCMWCGWLASAKENNVVGRGGPWLPRGGDLR